MAQDVTVEELARLDPREGFEIEYEQMRQDLGVEIGPEWIYIREADEEFQRHASEHEAVLVQGR